MAEKIKQINGKDFIFCPWRQKYVRLTPEEWVRQHFLQWLVSELHYPMSRIAVEHPIKVADVNKRCDAVVLNSYLEPLCIIEFKADSISLTQRVFDQVAVYNRRLNVPYFILSNGRTTYFCRVTPEGYEYQSQIPNYEQLWRE